MMKISVCILTSAHSPFDHRIFHKQALSLEEAGYGVTIIAPYDSIEYRDGIEVKGVPPKDSHSRRFLNLFHIYRLAFQQNADIYHFHDPGLLPVGAMLSRTTDAGVIYDAHEDYAHAFSKYEFPPNWIKPIFLRVFPMIEHFLARQCDGIITADEPTAEKFRRRSHDNVIAIHNYPLGTYVSSKLKVTEEDDSFVLAYVGSLEKRRGLFKMLQLISELRKNGVDVRLWLLGSLSGELRNEVELFIHENDLTHCVELFGFVDYEEIFSYLSTADAGLLLLDPEQPDFQTNIPTKLFEYMHSGLPVISSILPSTERFLPEECGVFVDYHNIEGHVTQIKRFLESPKLRDRMGSAARELAQSEYSWEVEEERLLEFYSRLLNH